MKFEVGPYVYRLRVAHLGDQQFGRINHGARMIELSTCCPAPELLPTLLHELCHAWEATLPCRASDDPEVVADYYGAITTLVTRQLARQGGETGLARWHHHQTCRITESRGPVLVTQDEMPNDVPAEASTDPWDYLERPGKRGARTGAVDRRAGCVVCELVLGAPCLADKPQRYDAIATGWVVDRELYCPRCKRLQVWTEGATPAGAPNGVLVHEPIAASTMARRAWLAQHPKALEVDVDA